MLEVDSGTPNEGNRITCLYPHHNVAAICDGTVVAGHPRYLAHQQLITDPGHPTSAKARSEYHQILRQSASKTTPGEVLYRPLGVYDDHFGLSALPLMVQRTVARSRFATRFCTRREAPEIGTTSIGSPQECFDYILSTTSLRPLDAAGLQFLVGSRQVKIPVVTYR